MPESTTVAGIHRLERTGIVPEEHQPSGSGQSSSPGTGVAHLRVAPNHLPIRQGECQQNFLGMLIGRELRACAVISLTRGKRFGVGEQYIAALQSHYIEQTRDGIV